MKDISSEKKRRKELTNKQKNIPLPIFQQFEIPQYHPVL